MDREATPLAMSGEIEAIGDAMTGAVVARAVEPDAGEGTSGDADNCLNCGASLHGHHCHQCGQKAKVHRTLGAFGHDILHGVLHFDGKIWRTLPQLAWNPGHLTRRYIHGERAKFVSPLALFLFCVFLTFAAFSFAAGGKNEGIQIDPKGAAAANASTAIEKLKPERARIIKDIARLEALASQLGAPKEATDQLQERRNDLKGIETAIRLAQGGHCGGNGQFHQYRSARRRCV